MSILRIVIADARPIVRTGLRCALRERPGADVVAEVVDGGAVVEAMRVLRPDLVIIGMQLPVVNGIDVARRVDGGGPRIVGLSDVHSRAEAEQFVEAGGKAYLRSDCSIDELIRAIDEVLNGGIYVDDSVAGAAHAARARPGTRRAVTPREREVLQLLAEGKSTREIASILNLSVKTIETHRKHLMDKLDLHSIAELTKYAVREGITPLQV